MVSEWRMRTLLKKSFWKQLSGKTSLKLVLELKAHSKPEREIKAVEEIVSMIKKMGLETPDDIYHLFVSRIKGTDPSGSHKHSCILSERGLISTTTERIG